MNKAKWVHIGNKKHQDMLGRTKDINVINKVINMHRKRKSCQEADKRGLLKKNEQCSREVKWSFAFLFFITDPQNTLWVINRPWLAAKTPMSPGLLTLSLAKQIGRAIDQPASRWKYGVALSLELGTHTGGMVDDKVVEEASPGDQTAWALVPTLPLTNNGTYDIYLTLLLPPVKWAQT